MRLTPLLLVIPLLSSCEHAVDPELDEDEFVTRVYDGPKWPVDIVVEANLKDISYLGFNLIEGGRMFPCVESAAEARSLATEAGYYLDDSIRETEKHFEFQNARQGFGTGVLRVYRSAYLASLLLVGHYWAGSSIEAVGPLNFRPLTRDAVRDFFDLLWVQWNYNHGGAVLLERSVTEYADTIVLDAQEAIILGGDWGICDEISQMKTRYTVWKETGMVDVYRWRLPEVEGRCSRRYRLHDVGITDSRHPPSRTQASRE